MADKVTTTNTLALELNYLDAAQEEKTTTIKIPNPRSGLTEQTVREKTAELISNILRTEDQIESGDPSFTLQSSYTETEEKVELDIGWKD